jgi:hypothetical protein
MTMLTTALAILQSKTIPAASAGQAKGVMAGDSPTTYDVQRFLHGVSHSCIFLSAFQTT